MITVTSFETIIENSFEFDQLTASSSPLKQLLLIFRSVLVSVLFLVSLPLLPAWKTLRWGDLRRLAHFADKSLLNLWLMSIGFCQLHFSLHTQWLFSWVHDLAIYYRSFVLSSCCCYFDFTFPFTARDQLWHDWNQISNHHYRLLLFFHSSV